MTAAVSVDQVDALVQAGDVEGMLALLTGLSEVERRALAGAVKALSPADVDFGYDRPRKSAVSQVTRVFVSYAEREDLTVRSCDALRVAAAACLATPATIVSALRSRSLSRPPAEAGLDAVIAALELPGRPSAAAVARGMSEKLRPAAIGSDGELTLRLLRHTGEEPPVTEGLLRAWVRHVGMTDPAGRVFGAAEPVPGVVDRLRADPWTGGLLPHLFTVDGIGDELRGEWPGALAELAADDPARRAELLGLCLLRLRAGGRPVAIKPVVALHELLSPTDDECAEHRTEYLGLLTSPHVSVVAVGQTALRRLDETGRLSAAELVEAAQVVLPRPEKKLVRAHLAWLAAALARDPALIGAAVPGVANEAVDLAERALALVAEHLPAGGDAARAQLADVASGLEGDVRRQVDVLLDDPHTAAEPVQATGPAVASWVPAPVPPPITTAAEIAGLAEPFRHLMVDPVDLERVLAGIVHCARTDPEGLQRVLAPLAPPAEWSSAGMDLLRASAGLSPSAPIRYPTQEPAGVMVEGRVKELTAAIRAGAVPAALLATPATVDGTVDPERVLHLIAAAERDGWEPGAFDLSQALLRLPRVVDPAHVTEAESLRSPAGRAVARWLREGGLPDPEVRPAIVPGRGGRSMIRTVLVEPVPVPHPIRPDGLLAIPHRSTDELSDYSTRRFWPAVLPGHREIAAAHVLPLVAFGQPGEPAFAVLRTLAGGGGPLGPAMAQCLARGATADERAGRVATVDALVLLAERGELDGAALGVELVELLERGEGVLRRYAEVLTELHRAGAAAEVWAALRLLVPAVVVRAAPGPGAPDLLALASAVAAQLGVRELIAEVDVVAARSGSSRLVVEARRLARALRPHV
jgi:hypothetical protein